MFSFIKNLCSPSGGCPYQKALDYCTYADWNTPDQSSMQYVIECIHGRHKDVIRVEKAFLVFKSKFQKHQDKNNAAFRLKNLLILDRCTEEKCILDLVANYQYNRLFYDRNINDSSSQNKFIQQFICSYYLYIKTKADIYQKFPDQLKDYKTRKAYLNNANNLARIFQFIDLSLQIQKLLNQVNETLKKINRSPLLIQQILTYMLKAYIFMYTIVAISLQTLLGKLKTLKLTQLNTLDRLLKYFSRDFTNTFLNFLQTNKAIPAFKSIQYNEIIRIDPNYMNAFDKYYKLKVTEQAGQGAGTGTYQKTVVNTPTTTKSSILDSQEFQNGVKELPEEVWASLTQDLRFKHFPRHLMQEVPSSDDCIYSNTFMEYQNYYSPDFIRDNLPQAKQLTTPGLFKSTVLNKKSPILQKKRSQMEDMINSKGRKSQHIKERRPTNNFKQSIWLTWQNVYCEG